METAETIYKYFELALGYILNGPTAVERKKLAADAKISVQYISQILNPKRPQKASLRAQNKIAAAAGYSYEEFLRLGKYIANYGGPTVGTRMLNAVYERLEQVMNAQGLNEDQLILKSKINTPKTNAWYFIGDPPDPDDIDKIEAATGFSGSWIMTGKEPRFAPSKPISINDHSKPEDLPHEEIITRFKNKEWARRMNAILLIIEQDPKKRAASEVMLKALADQIPAAKKTAQEDGDV